MPSSDAHSGLNAFFASAFEARVRRSPQTLAALGRKEDQDKLDDWSEPAREAEVTLLRNQLRQVSEYQDRELDAAAGLNVCVFESDTLQQLERLQYRDNDYPVNQKFGLHIDFPAFMLAKHPVADLGDAQNYLARLRALPEAMDQVIEQVRRRAAQGVLPPAFLFPQILADCRQFAQTAPSDNLLYADFFAKLDVLALPTHEQRSLCRAVLVALREAVIPAYRRLIDCLEALQAQAPEQGGAWSLPDGEAYYAHCLRRHTSTALSADDIHRLGEQEIARIRSEMRTLKDGLGFPGTLEEMFEYARSSQDFYFPQTAAGRQAYLDELNLAIDQARPLLPRLFGRLPEDVLRVVPVEPHREATAGIAFYEGPARDGSRPGMFYVNLYDLRQMPRFTIEALAYHEALPGHHLQFSIANRLALPEFRRMADYTAYVEGWGLYAERLMKEEGLYRDPWSDFGRLVQELKRACRLVVDTGLHARRWTRQQAIEFMLENVPSSPGQITKEVDRYLVMPGQATSYTVGMAEILGLRERARAQLGADFSLSAFHDQVLGHGPLPLSVLDEQLRTWMTRGYRA